MQVEASTCEEDEIARVFEKYAEDTPAPHTFKHLPQQKLHEALQQCNVLLAKNDIAELFRTSDLNDDGFIELDEFKKAVQTPSMVEQWAQSLPLAKLLADALPKYEDQSHRDPLVVVSELTPEEIGYVCEGYCEGLNLVLQKHVALLKKGFDAMSQKAKEVDESSSAGKFEVLRLSCGSIDDFHGGLQKRIGACHLDFYSGMEAEHRTKKGWDHTFTSSNFHLTSTPREEWDVVVRRSAVKEGNMRGDRVIPIIDDLLQNDAAKKSNLTRAEVIAIVLYTGPMFTVYNSILRHFPEATWESFRSYDNLFQTTIFVLASAVQKISRVMKLPEGVRLYRGLGGTLDLPDCFFKRDEHGCRGFSEWGFMSTTSDKNVAIGYSGVKGNTAKVPFVFEIHAGAVDRGACIRDFSQYAAEVEYLFVPCSFLEQDGPTRLEVTAEGVVKIIPAKVNANLKTPTVEELVGQKRALHVSAFAHLVHDVERELYDAAAALDATGRLADDPTRIESDSVEGFIARIVQQCKDVLARHQAVPPEEYADDRRFRGLVLEMFDIKVMAQSKLDEWLENKSSSFIRFRWNAALRTVHRRWMAYLSRPGRLANCSADERQAAALRLCKLCGLVVTSVDERNELGETRLMAAAAEGREKIFLKMLVDAGADVNQGRPDGVTAVWLAAQFGHVACVSALAELGADLNQAANDGATPVYIAAQGGNLECIELLAQLKADVNSADKKGLTPAHQAAMNGHVDCIELLDKLHADVNRKDDSGSSPLDLAKKTKINWAGMQKVLEAKKTFLSKLSLGASRRKSLLVAQTHKLIISTGDIGDIDGFMAVAEYAKVGADVLFVMNYPAYINVKPGEVDGAYAEKNPGLGYKYSAKEVFEAAPLDDRHEYVEFLRRYDGLTEGEQMKGAMTDMAFHMLTSIWDEGISNKGRLFFCIGGVNSVNPFSAKAIKNEVYVYSKLIPKDCKKLSTIEGTVFDAAGQQCLLELSKYRDIYMDFNGSMAFWNERWLNDMSQDDVVRKLKGLFIMGGVYANTRPITAPSIKGVLNRFSSATMNQLYHPQHAADFFAFAACHKVPAYIVTNNAVEDLGTDAAMEHFLHANGLGGKMLYEFAHAHYNSRHKPAKKPFDYYAALALTTLASDGNGSAVLHARPRRLFYNNVYGITYVAGVADTWESTRTAYIRTIDVAEIPDDDEGTRTKKENFRKEIAMLKSISHLDSEPVFDLCFHLDRDTGKLALVAAEANDTLPRTASASEPAPPDVAAAEEAASSPADAAGAEQEECGLTSAP